jgi:hypothetical protein
VTEEAVKYLPATVLALMQQVAYPALQAVWHPAQVIGPARAVVETTATMMRVGRTLIFILASVME